MRRWCFWRTSGWVRRPRDTPHARNADLLYWAALEFNESTGLPLHLQWQDFLTLPTGIGGAHE